MHLTQHVYLLSGFAYGLHPNVYAIEGKTGLILIDTGLWHEDYACITERRKEWKLQEKPIKAVLLTHSHFDHAGNAHLFRKNGAPIYAGNGDAQGIALGDERTIDYTYSMPFTACKVDNILTGGEVFEIDGVMIECIHAPGHSVGSMVYYASIDQKKIMFTGDFIRSGENCASAKLGFSGAEDFDPMVYLSSLKKIRQWKPDIVLAGHHQPCMVDGWKLLNKAYTHALVYWRTPSVVD